MDTSSAGDISQSQRELASHPIDDSDVNNGDHAGDHVEEEPLSPIRTSPASPPAFKVRPGTSLTAQTKQRNLALPLLLAGGALAVLAALLRALQKRRRVVRRAGVRQEALFTTVVHLPPPEKLADVPLLTGRSFVVSDRVDVQAVETRFGSAAWRRGRAPAQHSSPVVDVLAAHGACCRAVVRSEPLGLGPLLAAGCAPGVPNPAGAGFHHGGGEYGAAACVASGQAQLALAVDDAGTAAVPAAACGAYALRVSEGALPLEGMSAACPRLARPALLAADPGLLLRAGRALGLPPKAPSTEAVTCLVAEDFFAACEQEVADALPAVVDAVKRWAGQDQAKGLMLGDWVFHRVAGLRAFLPPPPPSAANGGSGSGGGGRAREVLTALAAAAAAVRAYEFCQLHGDWLAAQPVGAVEPEVLAYWREAQGTSEERYRAATQLAAELDDALHGALLDGYLFVLPTAPGPAPPAGDAAAVAAYRAGAGELGALAALSGAPQAVLPLPRAGALPLSVSLVGLHKRDLALLAAAAKLGPMLQQEAARRAARAAGAGQQAAAGGSQRRGRAAAVPSPQAEAEARAEACKAEGNAAFKAGRFEDAARHYSAAIAVHPRAAVYYANRAMAHLKLGLYSAAEADCDAALGLELSVKALLRRGSARMAQGNAAGAKADFVQALALEPQNRQAREELRALAALEETAGF